jgi:hypothetical protein
VIGKFIAIDEPTEYWDPHSGSATFQKADKDWAYLLGNRIVRRWFRIESLTKRPDGLWDLGTEGFKPKLLHEPNYWTEGHYIELSYIITAGSWAIDVRNALGPRKYYPGGTPQERAIRLAPFQNAHDAFRPGDPITQPAGPTPWTPTSYRSRNVNLFPPSIAGDCFLAENGGPTNLGTGLSIYDRFRSHESLEEVLDKQKDGRTSFVEGIAIGACTSYGIAISGPVAVAAMLLTYDAHGNKKPILWAGDDPKVHTSIYGDPVGGDFVIETSGSVKLKSKGTIEQGGLSGTSQAANNLRGVGFPVAPNSTTAVIVFATPEYDDQYAIVAECDWLTVKAVQNKTSSGFTVKFATAAPAAGGHVDWLLVR